MAASLQVVATLLAIYIVSVAIKRWSLGRHYSEVARKLGCQPASKYFNWDPCLGLDAMLRFGLRTLQGNSSEEYRKLQQKLGSTFMMKRLTKDHFIITSSPKNIQAITATKFDDWGVAPARQDIAVPFMENGIFTDDGESWRHARSLIRPTFSRAEVADLEHFEEHVGRFLKLIPKNGSIFDLQELSRRLVSEHSNRLIISADPTCEQFLDTSSEFIFGRSIHSLYPETPSDTFEFMKAFDYSLMGLALRLLSGPLLPLFSLDPTYKRAYTKVHKFVDKNIQIALDRRQKKKAEIGDPPEENRGARKPYVLLNQLVLETQDVFSLRAQTLNIFFPARDTAAFAFSNVMFELARHPKYWDELRTEVLDIGDAKLTFELIKSLPVAKAIINETLRLHMPATRLSKNALKDTILPVGGGRDQLSPLFVPKGTYIEMDLYSLHRDTEIWGDDASQFNPSRWTKGRVLWEAKWEYLPFSGGIRMCPAQPMALAQITYLLVRMAQEYKAIRNEDNVFEFVEEIKMTVSSRNGAKISLVPT